MTAADPEAHSAFNTYSSATIASCDVENCCRRLRMEHSLQSKVVLICRVVWRSGIGCRRLDGRRTHSSCLK